MMSFERKYISDAEGIKNVEFGKNTLSALNRSGTSDYFAIMKELSEVEFKSILFLLMDFIGCETYLSLKSFTKEQLQEYFEELCRTNFFVNTLTIELLGTIKNYRLLRKAGVCKHKFLDMKPRISSFWKLLYSICDNLDDSDVLKLRNWFCVESTLTSAEDVLCSLYNTKKINEEDNFQEFIDALTQLRLFDHLQKVKDYISKKVTLKKLEAYHIRNPSVTNRCGLAIILNQENFTRENLDNLPVLEDRTGSKVDEEKLTKLWENFGFVVKSYNNLSSEEIHLLFSNLSRRKCQDFDIFVACLLSHGDKNVIYGSDSRPVSVDALISIVANKCPFLNDKPKLFFVQACQGKRQQKGLALNTCVLSEMFETDAVPELTDIPQYSDIYKATCTIQQFVSYRSPMTGSLFVTELVENLKMYGSTEELETTMKRVKDAVAKKTIEVKNESFKQMSITSGTLRKLVIFKRMTY